MSIFGDRLREILRLRNVTQKALAKELELNYKSVNSYVNGIFNPSLETLARISIFLNISADYLIGLTPEPRPLQEIEDPYLADVLMIRRSYVSMTDDQRKAIIDLVSSIVQK